MMHFRQRTLITTPPDQPESTELSTATGAERPTNGGIANIAANKERRPDDL